MKKPQQSQAIVKAEPAKTPFVTVDMANFGNHKLPKALPDNLAAYTNNLPMDELVVDVMLIGRNFKAFKDWFADHAEFVWSLRERLPERGPNSIQIKRGDKIQVFTWSEFCLEFFGVSDRWVRKQRQLYEGMAKEPQLPEPDKTKKKPRPSREQQLISELASETLEHKAATSELRYVNAMAELRSLVKLVRTTEDRAKQLQYLDDLEKRLAALDVEPPLPGLKLKLEELELKAETHAKAKAAKGKAAGEEL